MGKQENSNDDEDMFVTLSLDDDSEVECRILTIFEAADQDYIALLPLDENGADNAEGRSTSTAILKMKTAILPWTISPMMKNTRSSLTVLMNF